MKIVSVAPTLPWSGVAHAGGVYYLQHLRTLATIADVTVVAPDTAENREAADHAAEEPWRIRLTPPDPLLAKPFAAPVRKGLNFWRLITPHAEFRAGLLRAAAEAAADADVVELQWPHFGSLIVPLRERLAGPGRTPKLVLVPHDLLSQKTERERAQGSGAVKLRASLALRRLTRLEAVNNAAADAVIVFSDKDAEFISSSSTVVHVILPPLATPVVEGATGDGIRRALFVGDFTRQLNIDAAQWLLREIWPLVLRRAPDAVLVLAGRCTDDVRDTLAAASPNTQITGYVDDLDSYYATATVALAPLLAGAGLKFKVASAMLAGLPVVATPVGAEGYPADQDLFVAVTDDVPAFADATADVLLDPGRFEEQVARAQGWAEQSFSPAGFGARLTAIYSALIPTT